MRTGPQIRGDRRFGRGQDRHHTFLAALAENLKCFGQRRIRAFQGKRLGYAQAAAPQQGQNRHVARAMDRGPTSGPRVRAIHDRMSEMVICAKALRPWLWAL